LDYLISKFRTNRIKYKINFEYKKDIDLKKLRKYISKHNFKFKPYPYQLKAVHDVLRFNYVTGESITGTGKSFIISMLSKMMLDKNYKTLIIVPKKDLVEQMYDNFLDYFGNKYSDSLQKINDDYLIKHFQKNIIISTWQTLQNKSDESFSIFDCVIADECDVMAKYDSKYRQIVMNCNNAKYILGMTGTMPKDHIIDYHNIVGVLGKHIVYTTEKKMMDKGIVSKIDIKAVKLIYPRSYYDDYKEYMEDTTIHIGDTVETRNKKWFDVNIKEFDENVVDKEFKITDTIGMTKFKSGDTILDQRWMKTKSNFQKEIEFLSKLEKRNEFLLNYINNLKGNILVLTSFIKTESNIIMDYFNNKLKKNLMFLEGSVKTPDRRVMFNTLEKSDDNLLIALRKTMDRGTSINNLQHFVLLSSIKNASTLRQMIGRIIRLDKKTNMATVHDIVDCIFNPEKKKFSNSMKHYIERKKTYYERYFELNEEKNEIK